MDARNNAGEADREREFAHVSSEPEGLHRSEQPQYNYEAVEYEGQQVAPQENEAFLPNAHPAAAAHRNLVQPDHYNFKGFVLFCFGTPGVSSRCCSLLMLLYFMVLFTVGIAILVLAIVGLTVTSNCSMPRPYHVYSGILSILSGLLFLLAVMNGGCTWAWKTSVLPASCTRSFLPLIIIAFILSLAHVSLMTALASVLIMSTIYKDKYNCDGVKWLEDSKVHVIWTLSALGVWAVCFVVALIPATIIFCKKYKPRQEEHNNIE